MGSGSERLDFEKAISAMYFLSKLKINPGFILGSLSRDCFYWKAIVDDCID